MNKAEAIAVLRELFAVCPELGNADFVSLDPDDVNVNSKGVYKIRLRVNLDEQSKSTIKPILDSYKLEISQAQDLIVIYG